MWEANGSFQRRPKEKINVLSRAPHWHTDKRFSPREESRLRSDENEQAPLHLHGEKQGRRNFFFLLGSEPRGEVALFLCLCISESLQQKGLLSVLRDGE